MHLIKAIPSILSMQQKNLRLNWTCIFFGQIFRRFWQDRKAKALINYFLLGIIFAPAAGLNLFSNKT